MEMWEFSVMLVLLLDVPNQETCIAFCELFDLPTDFVFCRTTRRLSKIVERSDGSFAVTELEALKNNCYASSPYIRTH
jgi:hypothetical protein